MAFSLTASARACWVARRQILWPSAVAAHHTYTLHADAEARLALTAAGLQGGQTWALELDPAGAAAPVRAKFPHLAGLPALTLDEAAQVSDLLRGQVVVAAHDRGGRLVDVTALQIPGVLDELYPYAGPLGLAWEGGRPVLRVWAPTARAVRVHLFHNSTDAAVQRRPMVWDAASGVWTLAGQPAWKGWYYLYEVEVYTRATGRIERNLVTDPYSLSLSTNSRRSQIVEADDPALRPAGWTSLVKPPLEAPEDSVIYELHVRDFSSHDHTVPEAERGTFRAFTRLNSHGMRHLRSLAEAGLTHVHLLPAFDFATVDEDRHRRAEPDETFLQTLPPDSPRQQEIVQALHQRDGFNWGYDPLHFLAPEGSYATDPDGPARLREFREMVSALNRIGLRVVMDVVFNHMHASGQDAHAVLDRIVPGYYHRLDAEGRVETSTCCANTATEHDQMRKLMVDALVWWARAYKVDGFRFDLMGHHMLADLQAVRAALDVLTLDRDGVDGRQIILYGEAWDFGEVAGGARGRNASQVNLGGAGLGAFNDRFRDGVRGGAPFGAYREQGFATGLFFEPNAAETRPADEQRRRLLEGADWIRTGLAGGLRDFSFETAGGAVLAGEAISYNGPPAGYTRAPRENVPYVAAHDNETLFDIIQIRAAAGTPLAERVRLNNLAVSLVLLAQGLPFFHAGDDLLRSKSGDRNSYDSGDWFNRLDFTYADNNWGAGLPPYSENSERWAFLAPLLADPLLKPGQTEILAAAAHFREFLRIRRSSGLFRLRTAAEVARRLRFFNTGPGQLPGLIGLRLDNSGPAPLADPYRQIAAVCNAAPFPQVVVVEALRGAALRLHPILAASLDLVVRAARFEPAAGAFTVPGRTTAVFVETF